MLEAGGVARGWRPGVPALQEQIAMSAFWRPREGAAWPETWSTPRVLCLARNSDQVKLSA